MVSRGCRSQRGCEIVEFLKIERIVSNLVDLMGAYRWIIVGTGICTAAILSGLAAPIAERLEEVQGPGCPNHEPVPVRAVARASSQRPRFCHSCLVRRLHVLVNPFCC